VQPYPFLCKSRLLCKAAHSHMKITGLELFLIPSLGVAVTYIGYRLLSRKKKQGAGVPFAVIGFLCRLAGPLLLVLSILLWLFVISMVM
jgi:hypothetical protein